MTTNKWLKNKSLKGRTVAVNGATGGIGKQLCLHLASLGANIVTVDRSKEKAEALKNELTAKFPSVSISHIRADLESIEEVKEAAQRLKEIGIDHLILNAGAYAIPRHVCSMGFNNVFQINFVSPYYLAKELLPSISKRGGRVVAVGSIAHNYSRTDPSDVDFSSRQSSAKVYGNAKRYLMFSLWGLEEYRQSVCVTHPGITSTNITAHYPKPLYAIIKYPMKIIFARPRKASLCVLEGLFTTTQKNEWIGPSLFGIWGFPKKKRLESCSESEAERICSLAESLCFNG